MKRVAIALIQDWKQDILMGRRSDNGLMSQPGGHCERGECPYESCVREVKEETGLDPKTVKLVKVKMGGKDGKVMIYLFEVTVDPEQQVDTSNDPDKEFKHLEYVDPSTVMDELHVPIEYNTLLQYWMDN